MLEHGHGGSIVNITSILGQQGEAGTGPYSASKGGLGLLGQSMAMELAPEGIRVNSVAPGNMLTVMHEEHVQGLANAAQIGYDQALEQVRVTIPIGRHGTAEDIANTVAWLLSPDSSYVTGQTIGVNGGVMLT
jgi:NAD(P)-dependent dehydrogenase (short-subunit alcohol dehydrogenase family)